MGSFCYLTNQCYESYVKSQLILGRKSLIKDTGMLVKNRAYFKEVPAIRICLWLCIGIILANYTPVLLTPILALGTILFMGVILLKIRYKNLIINTLLITLGIVLFILQKPSSHRYYVDENNSNNFYFVGTIDSEPKVGKSTRAKVKILAKRDSNLHWQPKSGNIIAYFKQDSLAPELKIGQTVLMHGALSRIQKNQNPLAFDFQRYMNYQSIEYQIFVRSDAWSIIKEPENNLKNFTANLRQYCIQTIKKYIKNEDNRAIASAMLLGYRNNLSEEIYTAYTDTGAVHVLAVSGLHVGIVNIILLYCLFFLPQRRTWSNAIRAIFTIAGIWLFALLTGAAPAVLRASVMFSLFTLGSIFYPRMNAYNILGSSAIILLLYNPFLLFQGSFQFSYLALFSILYFQPKISKWYMPRYWLDKQIWGLLTVAIAAQVLVFPVTIYYFHKFAASFWISGIAAISLAFLIIALGMVVLILSPISETFTTWAAWLLERVLDLFIGIIKCIQKLPYSSLNDLWLSESQMYILYLGLASMMCWITFKSRRWIFPILCTTIIFLGISLSRNVNTNRQKFIIVYDVQRELIVDFIQGHSAYEYTSNDENQKLLKFARANFRLSKKISEITPLDSIHHSNQVYKNNGVISFSEQTIAIADKNHHEWRYLNNIDYLIIGSIYTDSFLRLIEDKNIGQIIISNKMYPKWSKNLRQLLDEAEIPYLFTGDQAVIINLNA